MNRIQTARLKALITHGNRFVRNSAGTMGVMFALGLTPIIGLVGAALDYNAASQARNHLQQAADAAVLAAAGLPAGTSHEDRQKLARAIFASNAGGFPGVSGASGSLSDIGNGAYRFTFSGSVPTNLIKVIGQSTIPVAVTAEARRNASGGGPLEFVIAFDITESTFFDDAQRPQALKAMKDFVTGVYAGAQRDTVFGSIMPFHDRVRLPANRAHAWAQGSSPQNWQGCLKPRYQLANGKPYPFEAGRTWRRLLPGEPFRLTDDPPSILQFQYEANHQPYTDKNGWTYDVRCNGAAATVAETAPEPLIAAIDNMGRHGSGRFDEAMAWAWRMVSPRWRNQWNRGNYPRQAAETRKLVVFVTDGRNGFDNSELLDASGNFTDWGFNTGNRMAFESMERVCQGMKQQGIEVAVLQLPGNNHSTPYFQRCASPERYFTINSIESFRAAFRNLAGTVDMVRLTR